MSEREGFEPGVPCWVETWHDDPEPALNFCRGVFAVVSGAASRKAAMYT
jgi:hypothetical protein